MQQNQRIILYILVLIAGAAWMVLSASPGNAAVTSETRAAPQAGFPAPDFTLKTPTGETYVLSELRGQVVLVNLWATWCPPCRAEMPAMERMYQEYKDRGFIVLAVNTTSRDDPFAVVPFAEEHELTFPILLDETNEVATAYQLRSLPSSFFIDRDGIISEIVIGGPMSEAVLRTRIEEMIQ
jgi:cytochrome c biogenesis protein CcmG/thiol:disulfide interchange protein DsbE